MGYSVMFRSVCNVGSVGVTCHVISVTVSQFLLIQMDRVGSVPDLYNQVSEWVSE